MTVSRQIAAIISLAMLVLMLGALIESVRNTQNFLSEQLLSHAQDTATSLGLSLTPVLAQDDMASAQTMVNAIFDRGYYRQIVISDADGNQIISRTLDDHVEDVPPWFINHVALPTPIAEALIMDGWDQTGLLTIQSSAGYAYIQLWQTMTAKLIWFTSIGIGSTFLVLVVLHFVLAPLRHVEQQARAICERRFPILDKIPRTRELRNVVLAMNRLSSKVEEYITQQSAASEQYRAQANQDPATDLWNKRYFMASLREILENENEHASVTVFLLRLARFKEFNDQYGYTTGDALLKFRAMLLKNICTGLSNKTVISRLSGADFAVLFVDASMEEITLLAKQLTELSDKIGGMQERNFEHALNIGINHLELPAVNTAINLILANADTALKASINLGRNRWIINDFGSEYGLSRSEGRWREILNNIIDEKTVIPYFQPVKSINFLDDVLHFEVFARFPEVCPGDSDLFHPPGVIFVTAERFALTDELDKIVVNAVIGVAMEMPDDYPTIAINLTAASIGSDKFLDWLETELVKLPKLVRSRLAFEVTDSGAMHYKTEVAFLRTLLASHGVLFGLDQFGSGVETFGYLQSLLPDYIKIDRNFTLDVDKEEDNRFFIQSITKIAHTLDIQVIAHGVESSAEGTLLKELGVDGMQGHYVGHPKQMMELD
ncbi:MAG: EAL domain-containing protein [Magnetococcales bacterium]|nr:EAL domain-containing protein [Magnetococcales bacterium]